jgi:hypothetical protein
MTELTARVQTLASDDIVATSRDLTPDERAGLDELRRVLARAVDPTDMSAVSALWDANLVVAGGGHAPAGLVEAVGVALGDALLGAVPGTAWVVCPGPGGPMPGVAAATRPLAPVVPLADAQDRWADVTCGWIGSYVERAAAHLAASVVPQPRVPQDDEDAVAEPATEPQPEGLPVAATEPGAWAPIFASAPVAAPQPEPEAVPVAATAPEPEPVAAPEPEPTPEPVASAPEPEPEPTPEPVATAPARAQLPQPPTEQVQILALEALDRAVTALRHGVFDREAYVTVVDSSGTRTLSCPGDPGLVLHRAREAARNCGGRRVAIAWIERRPHGVPGPLESFPAVMVEASEPGQLGLRVAHRFVDDVLGTGPLGEPVLVGQVPPLL